MLRFSVQIWCSLFLIFKKYYHCRLVDRSMTYAVSLLPELMTLLDLVVVKPTHPDRRLSCQGHGADFWPLILAIFQHVLCVTNFVNTAVNSSKATSFCSLGVLCIIKCYYELHDSHCCWQTGFIIVDAGRDDVCNAIIWHRILLSL